MNMLWNSQVENVCVVFSFWHISGPITMVFSWYVIRVSNIFQRPSFAKILRDKTKQQYHHHRREVAQRNIVDTRAAREEAGNKVLERFPFIRVECVSVPYYPSDTVLLSLSRRRGVHPSGSSNSLLDSSGRPNSGRPPRLDLLGSAILHG